MRTMGRGEGKGGHRPRAVTWAQNGLNKMAELYMARGASGRKAQPSIWAGEFRVGRTGYESKENPITGSDFYK